MISRREMLKSAAALAAAGLKPGASRAGAPEARALLLAVAQSYASMTSYADRGTVSPMGGSERPQTVFTTLYKNPSRFRFEFSRGHPYPPLRHVTMRYVAGSDGTTAYTLNQMYRKTPELRPRADLATAVAAATGISLGAAHTIGRLLLPDVGGLSILDLVRARFADDTVVNGVPCCCVRAEHPQGGDLEYGIERSTRLIRRVATHFGKFPQEELREDIRVNPPLEDPEFAMERSES